MVLSPMTASSAVEPHSSNNHKRVDSWSTQRKYPWDWPRWSSSRKVPDFYMSQPGHMWSPKTPPRHVLCRMDTPEPQLAEHLLHSLQSAHSGHGPASQGSTWTVDHLLVDVIKGVPKIHAHTLNKQKISTALEMLFIYWDYIHSNAIILNKHEILKFRITYIYCNTIVIVIFWDYINFPAH